MSVPPPLSREQVRAVWRPLFPRIENSCTHGVVTLVVNDATRPPSFSMLAPLEDVLSGNVRVLFAAGAHRPVTAGEKRFLLGGLFEDAPWKSHDCDAEDLVNLGATSSGTPVLVNPWIMDKGLVVSVNSVEPHYFAGYTGGRKTFLPGVSGRETIVNNHYHACFPGAAPGMLSGNPVHLDMMEALSIIEEHTEIVQGNGVFHDENMVFFSVGSSASSFSSAADASAELSSIIIPSKSRVVVAYPGNPLDMSLYQSEKAIFNCHQAVETGGALLLVSRCREGLGADHLEYAFTSAADPAWRTPSRDDYRLGDHCIVRLKEIRERIHLALASELPETLVEKMGLEPVADVAAWLCRCGNETPLCIHRAGFLVPRIGGD